MNSERERAMNGLLNLLKGYVDEWHKEYSATETYWSFKGERLLKETPTGVIQTIPEVDLTGWEVQFRGALQQLKTYNNSKMEEASTRELCNKVEDLL